jgi:hypothetical protein
MGIESGIVAVIVISGYGTWDRWDCKKQVVITANDKLYNIDSRV